MSVRIGHRGDRWIELGPWHDHGMTGVGEVLRFHDADGALRFLREQVDAGDLRTLRALLNHEHPLLRGQADAVVLRLISQRLCTRALRAVARHEPRETVVERASVWQPARVELPAPEIRESAPAEESRSQPAAAMPADWDAEAQAHTLRAAAELGTPFCEICQRAARSSAAAAAPP